MAFLSHLIYGLQLGAIYALVALGYSMVYGIIRLINFAHGDIIMVASFVVWYLIARLNVPVWLSILICVAFTSLLGVVIEKLAYKPLRHSARISLLITAIGISFFLQNAAQLIFGAEPVMFENLFPGNLTLGTLTVSRVSVIIICVSIVLMVALVLLVNKTRMGRAMRAVSEDEGTAALMGINVNTTISFAFALGSALAAVAAILYSCAYTQISPTMGSMLGLKAFVAAVLGGIGSIPGAMLGGILIGICETLTKAYISSSFADAIVFGILIVVLIIRPAGLLGVKSKEKV